MSLVKASTPGETRRVMLARLADELRKRGRRVLVALSDSDHPVLYTVRDGGRRVAVVAVQAGDSWWYLWGKHEQMSADSSGLAACFLGASTEADVIDLFARRPEPRGHVKAVA
ncbi:hypothetical protein HDA32_005501 [Spinactinospora alkalitolerans]|uniref:Uncharacterized protein n=2 Tax=Spinactinospora alkalitolerans TaxID=687207 RepID=A0A852U2L6_9ACTN|nr:hypothetical protein [Spinactinospora alkalitolerans]NYE50381.1 hypothetical protein [Spinactinospora alkalitolerans]